MRYSDDGWLFQSEKMKNTTVKVSENDLFDLVRLAEEEDNRGKFISAEIERISGLPGRNARESLYNQLGLLSIAGTVVSHPYGDILTFPSTKHLFRGEIKKYDISRPSLNRAIAGLSPLNQELYRAVTNMRIEQFCKLLWKIRLVLYWEAKICDVNYKALAQHYGFETHLLDLTNDFRSALFFATCRYDKEADSYFPLTEADIQESEISRYGVIFHSPHWLLDCHKEMAALRLTALMQEHKDLQFPIAIDSGLLDGIAFQIGFQPLMRCHAQSGYLFPMRADAPLQQDVRFEKMYFNHSPELSKKVFDMMEGGAKVFPNEGISKLRTTLAAMKQTVTFSEDDLVAAYEHWQPNTELFPTIDDLRKALLNMDFSGGPIQIVPNDLEYPIAQGVLDEINAMYDGIDIGKIIGGKIRSTPAQKIRREARCRELYGKLI